MSEANVRRVRGIYESFAQGDIPAVLAAFDPQIEWREADTAQFLAAAGD